MEVTVNKSRKEMHNIQRKSSKWYTNWRFIAPIIIILGLIFTGISYYYQSNHFNSNIKINGIKVDGMTADQALHTLQKTVLNNVVYIGQQQMLDGQDSKMNFTKKDLQGVEKLLKTQWSFFPSKKAKDYSLLPSNQDQYRSQTMKKQLEEKLISINKNLKVPQDAAARLEKGKIVISKGVDGEQYDVASLLKDYDNQRYTSEIRLTPAYIKPIKEDSQVVKSEEKKLQELLGQTVEYKVQDKVYPLKGSELIKNASISKDMKVTIDAADIKNKIAEINKAQSTLNKNFTFKTHSGSVISVKGEGYGWALDVDKESAQIQAAFEKGDKSTTAVNIIGHGWKGEGYGYDVTANSGIGDTYAEVSIAEQRIWIYKKGKLITTTSVVTGKHSTGNDTKKGVWYILYKRSPSTLTGRELGGDETYSVKVNYWAPFTNDGQGFHDASWRSNWSSKAFLNAGSHGCVNTPPSAMKAVYDNLSTYEPVVIY